MKTPRMARLLLFPAAAAGLLITVTAPAATACDPTHACDQLLTVGAQGDAGSAGVDACAGGTCQGAGVQVPSGPSGRFWDGYVPGWHGNCGAIDPPPASCFVEIVPGPQPKCPISPISQVTSYCPADTFFYVSGNRVIVQSDGLGGFDSGPIGS